MATNIVPSSWKENKTKIKSVGSIDISLLETMRGYNHTGRKAILPKNKDGAGHVFFVRPQLNLSLANIQFNRLFVGLLNNNEVSMTNYVRMMLDPRLVGGYKIGTTVTYDKMLRASGSYFNNQHAFIPLLSNNLLTLSGWPDIVVPSMNRQKMLMGAQPTMVDGTTHIRQQISLNTSFRTSAGNPITNMLAYWSMYMSAVFAGDLAPYPDFIVEDELDYNTRVFRIITDTTGQFVTNIASTGPGFPEAVGIGRMFDYNYEDIYSYTTEAADFSFKFHGVEYNDPILIYEFNKIGAIFKPGLDRPYLTKGQDNASQLVKIPHGLKHMFNYEGYPHINYLTGEFELYIERNIVEALLDLRFDKSEVGDVKETLTKANTVKARMGIEELEAEKNIARGRANPTFKLGE